MHSGAVTLPVRPVTRASLDGDTRREPPAKRLAGDRPPKFPGVSGATADRPPRATRPTDGPGSDGVTGRGLCQAAGLFTSVL